MGRYRRAQNVLYAGRGQNRSQGTNKGRREKEVEEGGGGGICRTNKSSQTNVVIMFG
jgi:hypothetical protein